MNELSLFLILIRASLLSTGGTGNVPILHEDLLHRGWATEAQFGEALAVGQIAPGPNGLWVISLGYLVNGLRGAILAFLAILLPPMLVLVVERLYRRVKQHPAVEGFVVGLTLAVVGVFGLVMVRLLQGTGIDVVAVVVAVAAFALAWTSRIPILAIIAAGAAAGVAAYR